MTQILTARPSVAVVGGGYGGINLAKALDGVADVTLIDPTEAFVHNSSRLHRPAPATAPHTRRCWPPAAP